MLRRAIPAIAALAATACLAGCGSRQGEGDLRIAWIGAADAPFERGLRLSPPGQAIRTATTEGLVTLDARGDVVPALAERWIVTDDGLSYIFRLRDADWPGGDAIEADEVRDALRRTIRDLAGTSLGLDFAAVSEVRAMTGRVIEIDLASPVPDFLQLLAQPELGIVHKGRTAGPLAMEKKGDVARLTLLPPEARGLPTSPDWRKGTRALAVRALAVRRAVAAFSDGDVDLVLGGTLADLPLASTGPLSRGNLRLDAAQGLFGLVVTNTDGLLADPLRREALAMAIDRDTLLAPFNVSGWIASTRIVPGPIAGDAPERWAGQPVDARRTVAARRIAGYAGPRTLRIALPDGPGSDLLAGQLAKAWSAIGVTLVRAAPGTAADLVLVENLARFTGRRWYLDQLACAVRKPVCSPEADALVKAAAVEPDPVKREAMLVEAEATLSALGSYIAFGAPVRWSMVRGNIDGFAENRWAVHPLPPLAMGPT